MHDWPSHADAEIPSPQLVVAWLILDTLPTERVPRWAAHWLTAGYDGDALAELAGLHGNDPHEVRDLLRPALAECGVTAPDAEATAGEREQAAAMDAFAAIAKLHLDGRASARWVVDKVVEIAAPYYQKSIIGLPLGELFSLDGEWGAGWGRTIDQLRVVVRQACVEQLRASLEPTSHAGEPKPTC